MKTLKTWRNFAGNGGTATTTWNYDPYRGFLTNKAYADGKGPTYSYTGAGRLQTRLWARGTNTAYSYNNAGDLSGIAYDDGVTASIGYSYDRQGRQKSITVGTLSTASLTYSDAGQLLTETYSGGTLDSLGVTNIYDNFLRRTNISTVGVNTRYGYDTASRLLAVSDGVNSATYSYIANSPLVGQVFFTNNGVLRMVTTKNHDFLNRLTSISSAPSAASVLSFGYSYNSANQRTRSRLADGSYWRYENDSLGQVTSGKKYWADQSPVAGQQFEYSFDDIGNRASTKAGGDENGWNLRSASYSANNLNQYTSRDAPGYVDIMGLSFATSSVTVNALAAYRKGEYFRKELAVDNSSIPLWTNIIVAATGQTSATGRVFVAKRQETFGYDADGNMTNDGRWFLTWDAENRLTQIESLSDGPTLSKRKITWQFDAKGRRIRETTYDCSSGGYSVTNDLKFLSDGWRNIAELNATNNALVRSYVWGSDLSGSLDGAGGIGGLLMLNSTAGGAHFFAYDGNGNVSALVGAGDGTASAIYEYDPFGRTLRATGPLAKENSFRFSTKRADETTDVVLYEHRPCSPSLGRWLTRDPADEHDCELNLYGVVRNDVVDSNDPLGLWETKVHHTIIDRWLPNGYDHYSWRGHCIPVRRLLKEGSDHVDGELGNNFCDLLNPGFWMAQSSHGAYQHAMRSPKQQPIDAEVLWSRFINDHINTAKRAADLARERDPNSSVVSHK